MNIRLPHLPVLLSLLLGCTLAAAQQEGQPNACGALRNAYGPFDYRKDRDKLSIVDTHHFTPQVENLIRGISGPIGAEIDYVLRACPNHHRALVAMARWGAKSKTDKPAGANYTIEWYFDRALRFAPDDAIPRMLYARYLHGSGRTEQAAALLDATRDLAGDNAFTHYNIGMIFMEINQPDRALVQAHRAAELGFERPELRHLLERAGKWKDREK